MASKVADLPNEKWRPINGFEDQYMISSMGRVKILSRLIHRKTQNHMLRGEKIKIPTDCKGYLRIGLGNTDIKTNKTFFVHVLVCSHFIPKIKNKHQVNHKNLDRKDNRAENLEWCTPSENMRHSYKNSDRVRMSGVKNGRALFNEKQILKIRERISSGEPISDLAIKYNTSYQTIWRISKKIAYAEV